MKYEQEIRCSVVACNRRISRLMVTVADGEPLEKVKLELCATCRAKQSHAVSQYSKAKRTKNGKFRYSGFGGGDSALPAIMSAKTKV